VLPTLYTSSDIHFDSQLGQPQWGDELSQKIVWLVGQQQQTAEIRLNPAHLGPIEITLNITHDQGIQAHAQFVSSHLVVREALESALPKLREMMAENGIMIANVTVDSNSSQQQRNQTHHESFTTKYLNHSAGKNFDSFDESKTTNTTSNHSGMVNTFA
jgi:flagellar hook-length control protein FliK